MKLPKLKIGKYVAKFPIIQGGMSVRISRAPLAAAVANAGGIGVIGGSGVDVNEIANEVIEAKKLTKPGGVVGINIMFAVTKFFELVNASIDAGVDMIFTGAGFSRDIFKIGKEKNVPIVSIVSSAKFGVLAEKMGAAAVVVEGTEAGGHLGTDRSIKDIFPEVRAVVKSIPVIAAGGIMDGYEIADFLKNYKADGVQMATRFVVAEECSASKEFKEMYLNAEKEQVINVKSPVGMTGRALRNPFMNAVEQGKYPAVRCPYQCLKTCSRVYCIIQALINSQEGRVDKGLVFTGANVWRLKGKKIQPTAEIMAELVKEAESVE
ncbi:MAG: nitronate monooxygenase family protein [Candidatus Margulisbacteria bacterium]|nr:nitronate monooxygenase family protein [Candidatus Margulisiibacteriota bacterium]